MSRGFVSNLKFFTQLLVARTSPEVSSMAELAPPATMKTPVRAGLRARPGSGIPPTLFWGVAFGGVVIGRPKSGAKLSVRLVAH